MRNHFKRRAFTFIELIFVIVALGIVGGVALEAIRNNFEGIYKTKIHTNRAQDADAILDVLTKYFDNGVSSSIANFDGGVCIGAPQAWDMQDHMISLVSVDVDSLRQGAIPGWNDEVTVAGNNIQAADANYTSINNIANLAVFNRDSIATGICNRFWAGVGSNGYFTILGVTPGTLTLNAAPMDGHQKYILNTGYAFEVEDDGKLYLYTGFRPWAGQTFNNGQKRLLGENVAHFYATYNLAGMNGMEEVTDRGMIWRLKVCMRGLDASLSTNNSTEDQSICRERSIHVRY